MRTARLSPIAERNPGSPSTIPRACGAASARANAPAAVRSRDPLRRPCATPLSLYRCRRRNAPVSCALACLFHRTASARAFRLDLRVAERDPLALLHLEDAPALGVVVVFGAGVGALELVLLHLRRGHFRLLRGLVAALLKVFVALHRRLLRRRAAAGMHPEGLGVGARRRLVRVDGLAVLV